MATNSNCPDMTKVRVYGVSGGWLRVWSNGVLIQASGRK